MISVTYIMLKLYKNVKLFLLFMSLKNYNKQRLNMKNFVDQYEVNYKYIKQTIKVNTMIKTIKVTSLIGLILEGFLSLMFALFRNVNFRFVSFRDSNHS